MIRILPRQATYWLRIARISLLTLLVIVSGINQAHNGKRRGQLGNLIPQMYQPDHR